MPFPVVYRKGTDTLTNFNFLDTVVGAQATLYPSISNGTGGIVYSLAGTATDSDTVSISTGVNFPDPWAMDSDYDFDIIVEKAITLKGNALFNFTHHINHTGGAQVEGKMKIRIRKWDGTTETEIANETCDVIVNGAGGDTYAREQVTVVVPETKIRQGEYLRITLELWTYSAGGAAGGDYFCYLDPTNRATKGGHSSTFAAIIPLKAVVG